MMGHPGQVHHCCDIAGSLNRGTFRGLITVIPVVGLILCDPFAAALQMVQELKPQFVNLRRQQRELLMKSNDYKNDCTNNILIYRLDSLASSMKSSTGLASEPWKTIRVPVSLVRCFWQLCLFLLLFSDAFFFQPEEWRLVLCFKPNEVLEFLGHG